MAERRMLHRKAAVSSGLADLRDKQGPDAALFFVLLIPFYDRWGCVADDAAKLRAMVCPMWDDVAVADVKRWVGHMVRRKMLVRVRGAAGARGLRNPSFHEHQSGTSFEREAVSPYEPAEITDQWSRGRNAKDKTPAKQGGHDQVTTRSRPVTTRSGERKGREGRSRPTPSPTPSPPAVESAAAPPEPSPGAQSPPPELNGHGEPERVDLDAVEQAMSPTMAGAVRRARRTTKATRGRTA